jgi:hypothetical protein
MKMKKTLWSKRKRSEKKSRRMTPMIRAMKKRKVRKKRICDGGEGLGLQHVNEYVNHVNLLSKRE